MELLREAWETLVDREHGPFSFRLFVQPVMAIAIAFRSGRRDARDGRPPFLWHLLFSSRDRAHSIREVWGDVCTLFFVAAALDVAYQLVVTGWIHVIPMLLVATLLAVVPYAVARSVVNRLSRAYRKE